MADADEAAPEQSLAESEVGAEPTKVNKGLWDPYDTMIETVTGETSYPTAQRFEDLNLTPELLRGLHEVMKFEMPTKIQAICLPMILSPPFKNLVAQVHSESGKTTCLLVGMVGRIDPQIKDLQALCICTTSELANQYMQMLSKMGQYTRITSELASLANSSELKPILNRPGGAAQLMLGTADMIAASIMARTLNLSSVKILLFDMADQLLRSGGGCEDQCMKILRDVLPSNPDCQVILFCAALDGAVDDFAKKKGTLDDAGRICKGYNKIIVKPWSNELSQDCVDLIWLRHLYPGDSGTFKSIWRTKVPSDSDRLFHIPNLHPHAQIPCLMYMEKKGMCKFFYPIDNAFYRMDIPETAGARIRFSGYGWLLMSLEDSTIFLLNPLTRRRIELPPIPFGSGFISLSFSAPPTSTRCLVMGISGASACFNGLDIAVVRPGRMAWSTYRFDGLSELFYPSDSNPVYYRGIFYCLGASAGEIGRYNAVGQSWDILRPAAEGMVNQILVNRIFKSTRQSYLLEMDGALLGIFLCGPGRDVHILRCDLVGIVWSPIPALGDRVLYISRGASFVDEAVVKKKLANKILFPKFYGNNGVFYCLRTRKYQCFIGGLFFNSFDYGLRDIPLSTWIKPIKSET